MTMTSTPSTTPATPAKPVMTGPQILDKIIATVNADKRKQGSEGTWNRTVSKAGIPVIATHVVAGTFTLGAGQPAYANDMIELPKEATVWEYTKQDGTKVISRHAWGLSMLEIDKDDPLAAIPAPNADKLAEYVSGIRRAAELASLKAQNATLTARVAELETALEAATKPAASKPGTAAKPAGK